MTLAFDDAGRGEAVLFIHGHPFNRSMWRPQVAELSRSHRTIAPDLRGYGESPPAEDVVGLDQHAADLAEVLNRLDIARAWIVGLSMGGQIALEFYVHHADRVRGLVLADTFAQLDSSEARDARVQMADRLVREGMSRYATEVLPRMIAPCTVTEQPAVAAHVLRMMLQTVPAGAAASLRGRAARRDFVPLLDRVTVPTLIIVGEHDEFTPLRDAELMHSHIGHAQLAIIDDAGHIPNLEQPARFNTVLTTWLNARRDS